MTLAWATDPDDVAFLESGCALIVGLVTPDGEPLATRAWGLRVLPGRRVRVLVAADEARVVVEVAPGRPLALTATSVRTFRSLQLKGRVAAVEEPGEDDAVVAAAYLDAFLGDVEEIDGMPRGRVARMSATRLLAAVVDVDAAFDQTPGPAAGTALP